MSVELPDCGYRVTGKKLQCLHPRVHAPNHQVTENQCLNCQTWVKHKDPPRLLTDPAPLAPDSPGQGLGGAITRLCRYLLAVAHYWEHGSPNATVEEYETRLAICQPCSYQVDNYCTHPRCNCRLAGKTALRSKLRMATQKCPVDKWLAIKREGSKQRKRAALALRSLVARLQSATG